VQAPAAPESLLARCRRQERTIDRLSERVSTLHRGAKALKGENAELRAETSRLRDYRRFPCRTPRRMDDDQMVEVTLALDKRAPRCARSLVTECLRDRVATSALDYAQLLMSELVSNSLKHSRADDRHVAVSVELTPDWFRVGVLDAGSEAVIAVRPPDTETGEGFGLNLVRRLSERWGVEHPATGGTQVWAQLVRAGDVV